MHGRRITAAFGTSGWTTERHLEIARNFLRKGYRRVGPKLRCWPMPRLARVALSYGLLLPHEPETRPPVRLNDWHVRALALDPALPVAYAYLGQAMFPVGRP